MSRMTKAVLACSLLCMLVAPAALMAGSDFEWAPVTDADWQIIEDPVRGIRDAAIIFEKIVVDDEELIKKEHTYYTLYRRIRILSGEGREWGDALSDYLQEDQEIEEIRGRTLLRDGTSYELDEDQVQEKEVLVTKDFKVKQQAFSLPGVSDDCIVEYYLKYKLDGPPNRWLIQKDIYMIEGEYIWKVCRGRGLKGSEYRKFSKDVAPNYIVLHCEDELNVERRPSLKDTRELVFTIADVPAFESDPYSPPAISLKWQMHHYYAEPGPASVFWGEVMQGLEENIDAFVSYNHYVCEKAKFFSHYTRDSQKIRNACAWFNKNIANLDIDKSGEERKGNGCVSHVIEHGYGHSPEICCTYYDMLRELNIDAKMAFTIDRDDDFFIEDAKYWQFTRWLVAVPDDDGGYAFYKPGHDYLKPGQVDWYNEGTQALVAGDPDQIFYTIPHSAPEKNKNSGELVLAMDENLNLSGTLVEECTGQCAAAHRLGLRKTDEAGETQYLKEMMGESYPAFEPDSFEVDGMADSRLTLKLACNVQSDFAGQQMGNRLLMRPADFLSPQDNPFTSDERKYDIMLDYARETSQTVTVNFPEAWTVEAVPSDTTFSNKVGSCGMSFETGEGSVTIKRFSTITDPEWPVEAYPDIKDFFATRQAMNDMTVVLKREG